MQPLFTIHAGEYLVGLHVQQHLKLNAWIPAKDIGIDLLVTDGENRHAVSLQVKYGKDYLPDKKNRDFRPNYRCLSWFSVNRAKLDASRADFWVFVLHGFESDAADFVVIPTAELRRRMSEIHGSGTATLQTYLSSTKKGQCWETRGLTSSDILKQGVTGTCGDPVRDFTSYLNEKGWAAVAGKLNG